MSYREECSLIWENAGDDVIVVDQRPGFVPRKHRLRNYASLLFSVLDAPQSLTLLRQHAQREVERDGLRLIQLVLGRAASKFVEEPAEDELVTDFSAQEFLDAPERCLQPLIDSALVYVEALPRLTSRRLSLVGQGSAEESGDGMRYLALPVRAPHRPLALHWRSLGV